MDISSALLPCSGVLASVLNSQMHNLAVSHPASETSWSMRTPGKTGIPISLCQFLHYYDNKNILVSVCFLYLLVGLGASYLTPFPSSPDHSNGTFVL